MDEVHHDNLDRCHCLGGVYDDLAYASEIGGNVMDTIFLIIFGIWALALIIVIAVATWEGLL